MLRVRGLGKRYAHRGTPVDALRDIDLDVAAGSFLTVTGPSGSGKSTLLLALGGLLRPSAGEVHFRDLALHDLDQAALADYRRTYVGFVMQNFSLVPYLTALGNVMIPLALAGHDRATQRRSAAETLERVGLADRSDHLPRELSIGQQQRVAIARALAHGPALILADEPTGNLDPGLAADTLDLLGGLNTERGLTIVMVTHSPQAAARGSERVHLVAGRLAPQASAALARAP